MRNSLPGSATRAVVALSTCPRCGLQVQLPPDPQGFLCPRCRYPEPAPMPGPGATAGMPFGTFAVTFRSGRPFFVWFLPLLAVYVGLAIVANGLRASLNNPAVDIVIAILGWLSGAANIGFIVVFACWVHRVTTNLRALGLRDLRYTAGWATGSFFIPIANRFLAYQPMKEAWQRTVHPKVGTAPLTAWFVAWGMMLIVNLIAVIITGASIFAEVFSQIASRSGQQPDLTKYNLQLGLAGLAEAVATGVAAVLLLRATKLLQDSQDAQARTAGVLV